MKQSIRSWKPSKLKMTLVPMSLWHRHTLYQQHVKHKEYIIPTTSANKTKKNKKINSNFMNFISKDQILSIAH